MEVNPAARDMWAQPANEQEKAFKAWNSKLTPPQNASFDSQLRTPTLS